MPGSETARAGRVAVVDTRTQRVLMGIIPAPLPHHGLHHYLQRGERVFLSVPSGCMVLWARGGIAWAERGVAEREEGEREVSEGGVAERG
eukprot:1114211-Rhodomonas_salina.1